MPSSPAAQQSAAGIVSITSLRAAMRAQLGTAQASAPFLPASGEPSDFSVLTTSLSERVDEIHNRTRLSLPSMDSDDEEDDGLPSRAVTRAEARDREEEKAAFREMRHQVKASAVTAYTNGVSPATASCQDPPRGRTEEPVRQPRGRTTEAVAEAKPTRSSVHHNPSHDAKLHGPNSADDKSSWGFKEWMAHQRDQQSKHDSRQQEIFERVRVALNGAGMGDLGSVELEESVRIAWEGRVRADAERKREEGKREERRRQEKELDDLFQHIQVQEADPRHQGGFAGDRSRSETPYSDAGSVDGAKTVTLDVGMDDNELDELLESLRPAPSGAGEEEESGQQEVSELAEVLEELERASNNQVTGGWGSQRSNNDSNQRCPASGTTVSLLSTSGRADHIASPAANGHADRSTRISDIAAQHLSVGFRPLDARGPAALATELMRKRESLAAEAEDSFDDESSDGDEGDWAAQRSTMRDRGGEEGKDGGQDMGAKCGDEGVRRDGFGASVCETDVSEGKSSRDNDSRDTKVDEDILLALERECRVGRMMMSSVSYTSSPAKPEEESVRVHALDAQRLAD